MPTGIVDATTAAGPRRSPHPDRPWVMLNMVSSIDGAAALGGLSRGLSSDADKNMFQALRARADVVLVGARTASVERYRRARQSGTRVAVVSESLSVDPNLPLFDPLPDQSVESLPLVLIGANSASTRSDVVDRLAGRAEIVQIDSDDASSTDGTRGLDLLACVEHLGSLGARVVLCEGGPTLNASLLEADLVDEVNLTQAPLAVGGLAPRIALSSTSASAAQPEIPRNPETPRNFALEHVIADNDVLFVRWVRTRL